ncbi:MAG: hypothetical protein LBC92_00850, partial [Rickettsiales bacterium]|nr:hypothetical protein [Rickettsiales bacterium]
MDVVFSLLMGRRATFSAHTMRFQVCEDFFQGLDGVFMSSMQTESTDNRRNNVKLIRRATNGKVAASYNFYLTDGEYEKYCQLKRKCGGTDGSYEKFIEYCEQKQKEHNERM